MAKKLKPTVSNITKELKKYLRERGCLRAFKSRLHEFYIDGMTIEGFVTRQYPNCSVIAWITHSREITSRCKLHIVAEEWFSHYDELFSNEN